MTYTPDLSLSEGFALMWSQSPQRDSQKTSKPSSGRQSNVVTKTSEFHCLFLKTNKQTNKNTIFDIKFCEITSQNSSRATFFWRILSAEILNVTLLPPICWICKEHVRKIVSNTQTQRVKTTGKTADVTSWPALARLH